MAILDRFAPKLMNRRITLGFIIAMVLITSGFTLSFYSYNRYSDDTNRVQHTYEVISSLETILSLVKDVETGARGYVITEDTTFLEHAQRAQVLIPQRLTQLHALIGDDSLKIGRVGRLASLIRDKLVVTQTQQNSRQPSRASAIALSKTGKVRMDALRRHVAMMIDTERALMENRNRQADHSFRSVVAIIFTLSLLTFLALIMSYRLLEQELRHRQRVEDQLRTYENQLKEQIQQLEASNEELERFAFVASHDLQEPLRKIQSFSDLVTVRHGSQLNGDSLALIGKIAGSAERMSTLIRDLLNFSRISNQREPFRAVRLNDVVERILDDQELRIKGLNAQIDIGTLPTIPGVISQIDHLFSNLISNALKFTRPGVQPTLTIRAQPVDGQQYAGLIADRDYVEITVVDNGVGFDEKYIGHIFKLFQRLHGKTTFEGTGIGLAICKRVVVYHHGFITARSQPGRGTTFVVVLPQSQSFHYHDRSTSSETHSYPAG